MIGTIGLALAALALQTAAQTAPETPTVAPVDAPTSLPAVEVEGEHLTTDASSRNAPLVICERRPVTGSRFTRRVCQTRAYAQQNSMNARTYVQEQTRGVAPALDPATTGGF